MIVPKVVSIIIMFSFDPLRKKEQEAERKKMVENIKKANTNLFIIFKVFISSAKLRYIRT